MVAKEASEITPAIVKKHWEQLRKTRSGLCIYVHQSILSHNRKRLIQHHVPFIIPGNQMYLPELGVDLREHFKKAQETTKKFMPATQVVVIYALQRVLDVKLTPSELSSQLGYTRMTMTRAFDELEASKIGEVHKQGRERFWTFMGTKKELWEQIRPLMVNPVERRIWLKQTASLKKSKILAGLSALSHSSMLNPPQFPIYAISSGMWKNLKLSKNEILPSLDEAAAELEIWHYDPHLFEKEGCVDPFSLYLSLQESKDERIESALKEMMEKVE